MQLCGLLDSGYVECFLILKVTGTWVQFWILFCACSHQNGNRKRRTTTGVSTYHTWIPFQRISHRPSQTIVDRLEYCQHPRFRWTGDLVVQWPVLTLMGPSFPCMPLTPDLNLMKHYAFWVWQHSSHMSDNCVCPSHKLSQECWLPSCFVVISHTFSRKTEVGLELGMPMSMENCPQYRSIAQHKVDHKWNRLYVL